MNLKEIKEIVKLMNDNELAEIEVEREGGKLKIKKTSSGVYAMPAVHAPMPAQQPSKAADSSAAPEAPASDAGKNYKTIVSPMVGTFYRAPAPEAPPFIEVGGIVEVGQVVCIVEAMKLMNEIKSEVKGKVVNVTVENAEPVEFGQVLFEVEPV